MNDIYETRFGIFNHLNNPKKQPWDSVTLHETEENGYTSRLDETCDLYASSGVRDVFGIDLERFLEFPSEMTKMLIEKAGAVTRKKGQLLAQIEASMPKPP